RVEQASIRPEPKAARRSVGRRHSRQCAVELAPRKATRADEIRDVKYVEDLGSQFHVKPLLQLDDLRNLQVLRDKRVAETQAVRTVDREGGLPATGQSFAAYREVVIANKLVELGGRIDLAVERAAMTPRQQIAGDAIAVQIRRHDNGRRQAAVCSGNHGSAESARQIHQTVYGEPVRAVQPGRTEIRPRITIDERTLIGGQ